MTTCCRSILSKLVGIMLLAVITVGVVGCSFRMGEIKNNTNEPIDTPENATKDIVENKIYNESLSITDRYEVTTDTYQVAMIEEHKKNGSKGSENVITYPYIEIFENEELSEEWNQLVYELIGGNLRNRIQIEYNLYVEGCYTITYSDSEFLSIYIQVQIDRNHRQYGLTLSIKDGIINHINDFGISDEKILEGLKNSKLGYSVEFEDIVDGGYECIWDMYKESVNDYNFFLTDQTIGIIVQTIQTNGSYIAVDYSYDWKNLRKQ